MPRLPWAPFFLLSLQRWRPTWLRGLRILSLQGARWFGGAGGAGLGWASAVTPLRSRGWAGPCHVCARRPRPLPAAAVSQPVRDSGALRARFSLPALTLARFPPGRQSPPPPRSV